jgi:glycosyltransferase involved in cell wall biosynthesis
VTLPVKPRVLFVGRTRYDLPLSESLAKKWDALEKHMDYLVLAAAGRVERDDPRFDLSQPPLLVPEGPAFHISLPGRIRRAVDRFGPQVIVVQSPFEGLAALIALWRARSRPKLVIEVHGDWHSAARLYGSRLRRLYAPLAERLALRALRSADATRAVGPATAQLAEEATGRPPIATFPTYSDIESFLVQEPSSLPAVPTAIWIGVLERVKNPELLAQVWPRIAQRKADVRLVVVGSGRLDSVVRNLCARFPESVEWVPRLPASDVARRLDEATVLVLTSTSEGLPRVIIEAFSRGRGVVATAVGGVPDIVVGDRNGALVPLGDAEGFAEALLRVLDDRDLARRLGTNALADAQRFQRTPTEYSREMRTLVDRVREGETSASKEASSSTAEAPNRE